MFSGASLRRRLMRRTVGIIIISIASITSIREMRRRTRRGGRILGLEHVYIDSRTACQSPFFIVMRDDDDDDDDVPRPFFF